MRRKPYTQIGIRRLRCIRCGQPAFQQWCACADSRAYRPVCEDCGRQLNEHVLAFLNVESFFGVHLETYEEIQQTPCVRCGAPSEEQWSLSMAGTVQMCADCDLGLNKLILDFMGIPDREKKLLRYRLKQVRRDLFNFPDREKEAV